MIFETNTMKTNPRKGEKIENINNKVFPLHPLLSPAIFHDHPSSSTGLKKKKNESK